VYYLFAIPIAVLLYWSIHHLGEKFLGHEPLWLKIYASLALIYIVITPVVLVNYLSQSAGLPGSTSAFLMAITGFLVLFSAIKFYPKKVVQQGTEWK
jgi:hypothetical protein